jgi:hypothetical protein
MRTLDVQLTERNRALVQMDYEYLRNQMGRYVSDEMCALTLHKARYECTTIPAECRHASRAWLAEKGYGRMTGGPLLPEGELPE